MNRERSLKYELRSAQSGFAFEILFTIFWTMMAFNHPPVSPNLSGPELASFYTAHHTSILLGNSIAAAVAMLLIPWTAQLTLVMWRIEGNPPLLTIIQAIGGILTVWVFASCPAIWAAAAFRTDVDPGTLRAINDIGFMIFNLTYAVTSIQSVAAGIVGLWDTSARPVFPRWVCYWAIFTGIAFIPLTIMPFFKTGPLAWDGMLSFWALLTIYLLWTFSTGVCMVRDASRRLREVRGPETAEMRASA